MEVINKVCMGLAFILGLVFAVMGFVGLFVGISAHFTLPPVLGVLPLLVGWGIIAAVRTAWNDKQDKTEAEFDKPPLR